MSSPSPRRASTPPHRWRRRLRAAGLALGVAACGLTDPPLAWEAPRTVTGLATAATPAVRADGTLDTTGVAATVAAAAVRYDPLTGAVDSSALAAERDTLPARPDGACRPVVARDRDGALWAAWWRPRAGDSLAVLEAARSDDGSTWARTLVVDTLDRAAVGCARPQPAIAVDSVNGYVHLAYWSQAVEGPGLFYAHLMDPRATAFELPTALVYGDLPARTAVRSRGDTVAIAYEDPNSQRGRIALHLSLSAGHLFEQTARIIRVNPGQQPASDPAVALGGGRVVVAWRETSPRGDAIVVRAARIAPR